jgi:aminoglycoside phosphotransferase (APT) family kinase protein
MGSRDTDAAQVIVEFLDRSGLIPPGQTPHFEPLGGGVSSDIWLVRAGQAAFCVKKALPRLRVAADWQAPVERNATEVAWMKAVAAFMPEAVPEVLAADAHIAAFAMEYLPPGSHEQWKHQLLSGVVAPETAVLVGKRLARMHSVFATSATAARTFATDATFHSLRIEPYLLATARAHPDLAPILEDLADVTARTKISVVHGDVSPKNILVGPEGPVFLDAECAWFGDPAFDLAFCLNHLLLKTLCVPSVKADLLSAFDALSRAYLDRVDWEPAEALERRAARLLPGLLLARIDGKSPVEYLDDEVSKQTVRGAARALLTDLPGRLEDVQRVWNQASKK